MNFCHLTDFDETLYMTLHLDQNICNLHSLYLKEPETFLSDSQYTSGKKLS